MAVDAKKLAWVAQVLGVQVGSGGTGAFGKLRARWGAAQQTVGTELEKFRSSLLTHPAIKTDPRLRFVQASAAEISNMLPRPERDIDGLLASGTAKEILDAIGKYRQAVSGARELAGLENFASGTLKTKLDVRTPLLGALDEIETGIRAS